jgi:hypothetical protein
MSAIAPWARIVTSAWPVETSEEQYKDDSRVGTHV